jgi:hypothetical protein
VLLLLSLAALWLENALDVELALAKLVVQFSVGGQLFYSHLLSEIAWLFFSNGGHQAIKVHHFTFDPVSNVLKWVL